MPRITSKYASKTVVEIETVIEVYADGQLIVTLERNDDYRWQCERDGKPITARDAHDLLDWIADDAQSTDLAEFARLYPAFQLPQAPAGPVLVHILTQAEAGRFDHPLFAHVATPPTHPLVYCTYTYDYPEATETGVSCGRCTERHGQEVKHATGEHVAWCYRQAAHDDAEHAAELRAERGHPQHMVW